MVHENNGTAYQELEGNLVTGLPKIAARELRALFFESANELLQSLNEAGLEARDAPGRRRSDSSRAPRYPHLEG